MSQGMRDMLSNRRFAIPLIILLGTIFVGLILVGIVLILRPGDGGNDEVAQATSTTGPAPTALFTSSPTPTKSPTPRATPTLVPLGTPVTSGTATPAATEEAVATTGPTVQATSGTGSEVQATATPLPDDELADTGVGWGLILVSGVGLAGLVIFARRFRLA